MIDAKHFDEAYYRRYYEDPRTRVAAPEETRALADFVCGYLKYMDLTIRRVLDMGCGMGSWKPELKRHFPRATYTGVERSDYLCERFGWKKGSVDSFESDRAFDLVICQDVIQYLPARSADAAIRRLAALCRGALLFAVLTREDWEENCDQELTDGTGYLRSGRWYRKRLKKHFINAGGGLFIKRNADVVLYELEKID
ncbi:MAG TPA: class I SAM-dependent methyltransferase [Gammaproteobacteria bacterium]|nr:class I SAM-dependent methyltransferase [Gammaproteobacteria bacterium]